MAQTPEEVAAKTALDSERNSYWGRASTEQRTRIETSKLVATIALALAGTLVATSLQISPRGNLEVLSIVLIAISLLSVFAIIVLDQLHEPNVHEFIRTSTETDIVTLSNLQIALSMTLESNEKTVGIIKAFTLTSIGFAVAGSGVAVASMLGK